MKILGSLKTYNSSEISFSPISIGFECLDRDVFNAEMCYALLGKTGVKYARCQTGWAKCETEKGIYDFAWLDRVVDSLTAVGIEAWLNLGYGNPLYMPNLPNPTGVGCAPILYSEDTYRAWKSYVKALTEHFKDRITHFEIWNEPDIEHFWYPEKPDGKQYAKLVKDTAKVIRSVMPEAKIGAVVSNPYCTAFMKDLFSELENGEIQFFCQHIYTTVPEYKYSKQIKLIQKLIADCGLESVEIWQGEGGYPSWAYKNHWLVKDGADSERAQAIWQLRRYFIDLHCGITRSSFFQVADMWERAYEKAKEVVAKPAAHGILNGITYTPKESYRTISHLASLMNKPIKPADTFANVDFNTKDTCEFLSVQVMAFERNGKPMYCYYIPSSVSKEIDSTYTAKLETNIEIESPVLLDMYTGEVFEIEKTTNDGIVYGYLELPIKDYPLVVIDKNEIEIV